jgi:ATP-dependent 26S proteasome regulatory subunit
MDNAELERNWNMAKVNTPAVFLFEDFDAVFQGRKSVDEKGQLTFDQVLQVMSGVEECDGVVMCLTTNNFDSLDPAIVRPGRAEHSVEFGPLSYVQACTLADSIIQNDAWSPGFRRELVQMFRTDSKSLTGAFVQKEATRFALDKKFGEFV